MAFRGFDAVGLTSLAKDLDALGRNSGRLHQRLATVLTTAQQNLPPGKAASFDPDLQDLVGDVIPTPFFGRSRLPAVLGGELDAMQSSMHRRLKQMEGLRELAERGYPVNDAAVFQDENAPDQKRIDKALNDLKALDGQEFGMNGNRDDLTKLSQELDGLTAAELDTLFSRVDAADLARYNALLTDTGDSGWSPFDTNGLSDADRRKTLGLMLSKVSPQNIGKFTTAFPGVQPTFQNTAAYEEGGNSQNGQNNSGIHWQSPTDPLFDNGVSADDVNQRQFGDCWYVASLAALAQKDPKFVQDGIKKNPNGTVSVRVWDKDGKYEWVTMTDDLPTDQNGNPISTYGNGETWPAYYEKAFAMTYTGGDDGERGYGGIEGDDPKNADPYLTGKEGDDITKSGGFLGLGTKEDKDLGTLRKTFESGRAVTVSTPDDEDLEKNHPKAWDPAYCTNHAYYVRGFTADGKVILGNPWGVSGYPPITVSQDEFNTYFQGPEKFDVPQ